MSSWNDTIEYICVNFVKIQTLRFFSDLWVQLIQVSKTFNLSIISLWQINSKRFNNLLSAFSMRYSLYLIFKHVRKNIQHSSRLSKYSSYRQFNVTHCSVVWKFGFYLNKLWRLIIIFHHWLMRFLKFYLSLFFSIWINWYIKCNCFLFFN